MSNYSNKKRTLILLAIIFGSVIILGGSITLLVLRLVSTKVTGNLVVDGSAFSISKCQSGQGQALGFAGIQLKDDGGRRLRILKNPLDGTVSVSLFPANQDSGSNLGNCGNLTMIAQHSRVNYVINQSGTAVLDCEIGGHKVVGSVDFKNCH